MERVKVSVLYEINANARKFERVGGAGLRAMSE